METNQNRALQLHISYFLQYHEDFISITLTKTSTCSSTGVTISITLLLCPMPTQKWCDTGSSVPQDSHGLPYSPSEMIKSAPAPPQKCPGLDSKSYMRLTQITCLLPLLCRCSPGGQGCGANLYNSRPTPSLTICVSVHDSTVIAFCTCGFLFSFET